MTTEAQRRRHEQWLLEITDLPTAAGHEDRVIDWVRAWVNRRSDLRLRTDAAGNLVITIKGQRARRSTPPIYITAHLDHPAFVVSGMDGMTVALEFRGGVHPPYFDDAPIDLIDRHDRTHRAVITHYDPTTKPFKTATATLRRSAPDLRPGDIGRWAFRGRLPRISKGILHTHACDDLAAVAAALATLDVVRRRKLPAPVGVLLTRAEEIGFVGAIAAAKDETVPKSSRLICLENSRSFADSPIGGGPILRVGDRLSVFSPDLTNRIGRVMMAHEKKHPSFRWQRKLMPGGACEATTFSVYGYDSTCICLPLGNYHNMSDIDAVVGGARPAQVGPEYISVADYHGMIEMLVLCATILDTTDLPPLNEWMDGLYDAHGFVL